MTPEQFCQYYDHYDQIENADLGQAMFDAFQAVNVTALDSEIHEFHYKLWQCGYKIVPVQKPESKIG